MRENGSDGSDEGLICWALIPVKPGPHRKRRLMSVLDAGERAGVFEAMVVHVIAAARGGAGDRCDRSGGGWWRAAGG